MAAVLLVLAGLAPVAALPDRPPARIAGATRVDTAAAIARAAFPSSTTAIVARADDHADALAASALAGALEAPVVLTAPTQLPGATAAALDELGVTDVLVLGGEAAVAPAVEAELAARRRVERINGSDRYATAAAVARRSVAALAGAGRAVDTALLVSGEGFADALAAGPVAAAAGWPVLLTTRHALPASTVAALDELPDARVVVVGGTGAIDEEVVVHLGARGRTVARVAGPTRAATAVAVAQWAAAEGVLAEDEVVLARADDPADALAAAPFAALHRAPLLLTAGGVVGDETAAWLRSRCESGVGVTAVGGEASVAASVLDEALRLGRICDPRAVGIEVAVAVDEGAGLDPAAVVGEVGAIVADPRGWADPRRLPIALTADAPDATIVLAAPERALPDGCAIGCRDGDELLIPAAVWAAADAGARAYLVNHVLGHWFGLDDAPCADGAPPPVVGGPGCDPAPWPRHDERALVLQRYAPAVTLAFAGDVHGEGPVRDQLARGRNPLLPMAPVLSAADVAVVNLETAVGTSGTPADKTYTFQAPPALVTAIAGAGVDVVSLANNHALDYGVGALRETIALARAAGLSVVGAGENADEAYAPALLDVRGTAVAVVGLSRVFHTQSWAATATRPGLASAYDEAAAVEAVRRAAAQADVVVVAIHWGVERQECPDPSQLRLARLLTDAGADVVAGHHPHILQGVERRDDAVVAYSLGNFVWYHNRQPSADTGVLTVDVAAGGGAAWALHPARIDTAGSPQPLTGAAAAGILAAVSARSPGGGRCG